VPDAPHRRPISRTLLRLFGGAVVVALLATAASATTFFEDVGIISDAIGHGVLIKTPALAPTYAGQPVTILILGSDKRSESHIAYDRADPRHSDTILLAHLDPQSGQTTLMSVPRDLQASFVAHGQQYDDVKINSAFTEGGAPTTVQVVENLLHIKINDVIVIDFQSFAYLVNGLGCVYVDVDHLYDSGPYADYAHIYIPPGYRPLCYYQALSYVRYREQDSTYARDAREQDFIRQAKQQLGIRTDLLTNPGDLKQLLDQVSSNGGLATNIHGSNEVLRLIEIAESSVDEPVRQIQFPDVGSVGSATSGSEQVVPPPAELQAVVQSFLYGNAENTAKLPATTHHRHHHHASSSSGIAAGLVATPSYAYQDATVMGVRVPFPVEIPHLTSPDGFVPDDDAFYPFKELVPLLATHGGLRYSGYRITWEDGSALGAYYGIDGLNWTTPPLFHGAPSVELDGRSYMFVYNGKHYQDIGWIQGKDIYWVSNTIFDNLSNAQLLGMAESAGHI
jgi:LCP family protein required for cell wall assembly